jgi:hypothetical protein
MQVRRRGIALADVFGAVQRVPRDGVFFGYTGNDR